MNYLPILNEDEIRYICSVIPLKEWVSYFNQYPKDFAKVMPGFRAKSLKNQEQINNLIFRRYRQPFISSFIEKHISRWMEQIQQEISLLTDRGESKESAWLQTLPFSYFVDDIGIFFKLIGEEISTGNLALLRLSIITIRDLDIEVNELKDSFDESEKGQNQLKHDMKRMKAELDKLGKKLIVSSNEIEALNRTNTDLDKLKWVILAKEQEMEVLEKNVKQRDATIQQLKTELTATISEQVQLESRIREELKKQNENRLIEQEASVKPRCPKDIDEFRDYLGYNLENLGILTSFEYYSLLKDYICEILFTGKPILVNRNTGFLLMKCVSNALVSSLQVPTLVFAPDISGEAIDEFLSVKNRIICLDNFIGNFNESIISTICERHKDKIIFLTVAYDKTLRYVPDEFFKYCHYLNINRIEAFTHDTELTEDPSTIDEVETLNTYIKSDTVYAPLMKEILDEFDVCSGLSVYKSLMVSDESSLCRLLAFDVLPYCVDILNAVPFNISERLNKYVGDKGRCPYKELFRRWFS